VTEGVRDALALDERDVLPDGSACLTRVPQDWNGTLLRDLDFALWGVDPDMRARYDDLLRRGFAITGTARHRLRMWQYDPVREIGNMERLQDRFAARVGAPRRVIQYGCSGGGHLALAVAESFHDRVDGAVALAAHTPVWLMNTFLDGWFALRELIGPDHVRGGGAIEDLEITGLANDGSADVTAHGRTGPLVDAWRRAIDAAQATPLGRARIALAFTLGQWPAWVDDTAPEPALDDPDALQAAMHRTAWKNAANPGGEARIMFENAAQGQQLSWNTGIDHHALFDDATPAFRDAVRALYDRAGADPRADIDRLDDAPRVQASEHALAFWSQPGRTVVGRPGVPVIRLHRIGDHQVPYSLAQGYADRVAAIGGAERLRTLFVRATGHCNFSPAESSAAVALLLRRIDDGKWPATDADSANTFAASLDTGTPSHFMTLDAHRVRRYARDWVPNATAPGKTAD
jgi:hypothetical protein